MATLKKILGSTIQVLDDDPVNYAGSWSSGGAMNTARRDLASVGIQTASLGTGGYISTYSALNESYNGSAWSETTDLSTAKRSMGSFGTYTAALITGGYGSPTPLATTETFNGSSWTETTDLNAARNRIANSGTTTSGLAYGGTPPNTGASEYWNGSFRIFEVSKKRK